MANCPVTKSTSWDDMLPAELLLMIMDKLDDRVSLLHCRLVCTKWKAVANSSLERHVLSTWSKWNAADESQEATCFPVMSLIHSSARGHLLPSHFIACPLEFGKTMGNPFPTKSLSIIQRNRWAFKDSRRTTRIQVLKLLTNFGCHLTSFHLHGMSVTGTQINLLMKHLRNLKALTLSSIWMIEQKNPVASALIVSPPLNLQYLRLDSVSNSKFIHSLIDLCGKRLTSLEALDFELRPLQNYERSQTRRTWNHLTRLKITSATQKFLQNTISIPLQHLSMIILHFDPDVSLNDILSFLDKFSNTLTTLYLDVNFKRVQVTKGKVVRNPISFPFLKNLHICFPHNDKEEIFQVYEQWFLPKFPNLESIHWLYNFGSCYSLCYYDTHDFIEELRFGLNRVTYWQLCPKLECMMASSDKRGPKFDVKYTRDMFYVWEFEQVLAQFKANLKNYQSHETELTMPQNEIEINFH